MPKTLSHVISAFLDYLCKKYDYGERLLFFLESKDLVTEPHNKTCAFTLKRAFLIERDRERLDR